MQRKLCLFGTFKICCIVTYTTIKHFTAQFFILIVNKLNKILHRQHISRTKIIQGGVWCKEKKYHYTYNSYWEITNWNSLYYATFEYAVYFHPHYRIISLHNMRTENSTGMKWDQIYSSLCIRYLYDAWRQQGFSIDNIGLFMYIWLCTTNLLFS